MPNHAGRKVPFTVFVTPNSILNTAPTKNTHNSGGVTLVNAMLFQVRQMPDSTRQLSWQPLTPQESEMASQKKLPEIQG